MRLFSFLLFTGLLAAFLWLAAEVSVFLYVADEIGVGGAILLTLATSYAGVSLFRRIGGAARQRLFRVLQRPDTGLVLLDGGLRDGVVSALAATLLFLPGFLSDLVGVVLAAASSGFWLRGSADGPQEGTPGTPGVVDLSPDEWHHLKSVAALQKKP